MNELFNRFMNNYNDIVAILYFTSEVMLNIHNIVINDAKRKRHNVDPFSDVIALNKQSTRFYIRFNQSN